MLDDSNVSVSVTSPIISYVDGKPVMVFVDRLRADQDQTAATQQSDFHVIRKEQQGLVMYEVTHSSRRGSSII